MMMGDVVQKTLDMRDRCNDLRVGSMFLCRFLERRTKKNTIKIEILILWLKQSARVTPFNDSNT
jgi:hypothetical protein